MSIDVILSAISALLELILILIFVRVILTWLPIRPGNKLIELLNTLTDPILGPSKALLSKFEFFRKLPMDFSPLLAFLIISALIEIVDMLRVLFG